MPTADTSFEWRDVEAVLDSIRPALLLDGGNVKLLAIEGHDVRLEMLGSCRTCSSLPMTKRYGIEDALRDRLAHFGKVRWKDEEGQKPPVAPQRAEGL